MGHGIRTNQGAEARHVSRETSERLANYSEMLLKWNRKINLVSKKTSSDLWERHIDDSLQVWDYRPRAIKTWADLGTGAGLPGIVLAIAAKEQEPDLKLVLVEADSRKCAFLHIVATKLDLNVDVLNERIEKLAPLNADVVSARALAGLPKLLEMAKKHLKSGGICLFPKGETVHKEIEAARKFWTFDCISHPSQTRPASAILEIGAIERD